MVKYIGRQISVGVAKETTRGTAATSFFYLPKTDFSFDETMETIQDESSIGVIVDSRDTFVVKKKGEGDIGGNVEVNGIGFLFLSLLGSVASELDTTGAYKHTFDLANTNNSQSLTLAVIDPVEGAKTYPLAMIDSMTLSANEGEFATFSVTFKSKPGETTSLTASYDVDYKLLARHSIFKTATNLAGLSGATATCLRSFEITISKNLEEDYCMGSITPQDFINQMTSIEGSFTAVYTDATFKTAALSGTKKAIRFELLDSDTTIGVSSNPRVTIDLPLASFTEFSKDMGNDATVVQTLTFKGLYSEVDSSAINIEVVNTTASY